MSPADNFDIDFYNKVNESTCDPHLLSMLDFITKLGQKGTEFFNIIKFEFIFNKNEKINYFIKNHKLIILIFYIRDDIIIFQLI